MDLTWKKSLQKSHVPIFLIVFTENLSPKDIDTTINWKELFPHLSCISYIMSLWDVSMLLISSLQQSRYSSFYLDFRLQHLTSGTRKLSSKPSNALRRHWLSWASSPVQSQMIPNCFAAKLCKGTCHWWWRLLRSWISSLNFDLTTKSSFSAPASQVLLWNYFSISEFWPFPSVTAGDLFSSHFLHVSLKISHHATVATMVAPTFMEKNWGLPWWGWFWCAESQD